MGYDTTAWTTAGNTLTIGGTTMYADFNIGQNESVNFAVGYHYPIQYNAHSTGTFALAEDITFGNDPDPATSFTTASGASTDASLLINKLWYLPDNIYIDAVYSLEGATESTGDTTRMHLYSYTFTSGATACLTSGTLLAHNSDVTNAGNEQPYLSTWTVDSTSVSSGSVILAFFECDSLNSKYSVNVKVKYHLT